MTADQPPSVYFFDSSALVKRYTQETGTAWTEALCSSDENAIAIAQIGLVEVAAALSGKHRANAISDEKFERALADLLIDARDRFRQISIDNLVIEQAIQLTRRQKLRGCDAVQLASALSLNKSLLENKLPGITFVTADEDLLTAASNEGLLTENPNHHDDHSASQ
ncbi:MAG: type II toxin-antitoxin system VapC family toxin [Chloroflexi bacterium]|nr:type II toxin-antitoxin system VapC family toxin [Chloroflexota bacterium]